MCLSLLVELLCFKHPHQAVACCWWTAVVSLRAEVGCFCSAVVVPPPLEVVVDEEGIECGEVDVQLQEGGQEYALPAKH